jgi:hypothetical protein
MSDTVAQMRLLAASALRVDGDVASIFPLTLLAWANELEELKLELENLEYDWLERDN